MWTGLRGRLIQGSFKCSSPSWMQLLNVINFSRLRQISPARARYHPPALAYLEEDRDAQIHEWLREIDHALARVVDCHWADSEISLLWMRENNEGNTSVKDQTKTQTLILIYFYATSVAKRGFCIAEMKLLSSCPLGSAGARDYLDTRGNGVADLAIADERNAVPDSMKLPEERAQRAYDI